MFKATDFLLIIVSAICLGCAAVLMPWSELDMGLAKPAQVTSWGQALLDLPPMSELKNSGEKIQDFLVKHGAEPDSNLGDYTYALVIFGILTVLGVVFIVVGREEAEEKTVLPVK
jgi:hypothetical protein